MQPGRAQAESRPAPILKSATGPTSTNGARAKPGPKDAAKLLDGARRFREILDAQCLNECVFTLFAHARRSVEALRLGWVTFDPSLSSPSGFEREQFHRASTLPCACSASGGGSMGRTTLTRRTGFPRFLVIISRQHGADAPTNWVDAVKSSSSIRKSQTIGSYSTLRRSGSVPPRRGLSLGPVHGAAPSTSIGRWAVV